MTDEKPPGLGRSVAEAVLIAALTTLFNGLVERALDRFSDKDKPRRKRKKRDKLTPPA